MAVWWTNTSGPSSRAMNPKPFASLNHFTLPVAIYCPPTNVDSMPLSASFPRKLGVRVRALQNVSSVSGPSHAVRCSEIAEIVERVAKFISGGRRVRSRHHGADAGDAVRARRTQRVHVPWLDAADGDDRNPGPRCRGDGGDAERRAVTALR